MRAVVCSEFGEPETLAVSELAVPLPGPGEVLIDVGAAAVSFADTLMIRDMHQNKHDLPFAPGMEVAGKIAALGADVSGFSVGQRVMALVYDGGYAEKAKAKASETFAMPEGVSDEAAAALCSVYLTAHCALAFDARLAAGETLLVLGAAGGVGLAAVEVGKALGARVIAAAGGAEKTAAAKDHGADAVIDYRNEDLRARAIELSDGGVDVVFDPVAGDYYEPSFRALDWGGRYMTIGYAGGAIPKIPANLLLVKNRAALGFALMHYRRHKHDLLQQSGATLLNWAAEGVITPHIAAVTGLDGAPGAMRAVMDRKAIGKYVLKV